MTEKNFAQMNTFIERFCQWWFLRVEIWDMASIRQRRLIWGRYPQKICVEDFRENCESAWDRLHTARLLTPGFMFPRPLDTDIYIYKMEEMYVWGERESWHCLALHTSNRGAVFRKSWPAGCCCPPRLRFCKRQTRKGVFLCLLDGRQFVCSVRIITLFKRLVKMQIDRRMLDMWLHICIVCGPKLSACLPCTGVSMFV